MDTEQLTESESTERFSGRAELFRQARPGYPDAIVDVLRREAGLRNDSVVADIGAGTGLSSELFLRHFFAVQAIEPNAEMREAAAGLSDNYSNFSVLEGTAEATGLPSDSIDLIFVGTAFHWFDLPAARREFGRILKTGGFAALCWNQRRTARNPVGAAYEDVMLRLGTDYEQRWREDRKDPEFRVRELFGAARFHKRSFPNFQLLDSEALLQRALSSSWAPLRGEPGYEDFVREITGISNTYQVNGRVKFEYDAMLYYGQLEA